MARAAGQPYKFPARYTLFGVLYHEGTSASGGHYTVDVLPRVPPNTYGGSGEAWLHIDDETVSTVQNEVVCRNEGVDDRCVYMLFYHHTASMQT